MEQRQPLQPFEDQYQQQIEQAPWLAQIGVTPEQLAQEALEQQQWDVLYGQRADIRAADKMLQRTFFAYEEEDPAKRARMQGFAAAAEAQLIAARAEFAAMDQQQRMMMAIEDQRRKGEDDDDEEDVA